MISKDDFATQVYRLHDYLGRPRPRKESLAAWYADLPSWLSVTGLVASVDRAIREGGPLPANILQFVIDLAPRPQRALPAGMEQMDGKTAWANRQRLENLKKVMGIKGKKRDEVLALTATILAKDKRLHNDDRDLFFPLRDRMELHWNTPRAELLEQLERSITPKEVQEVLDEAP